MDLKTSLKLFLFFGFCLMILSCSQNTVTSPNAISSSTLVASTKSPVPDENPLRIFWNNIGWIKTTGIEKPGPNYWNPDNVIIDDEDNLHLFIRKEGRHWSCAGITTEGSLGFGTYSFTIKNRLTLPDNVVLGFFNYPTSDIGPDKTNEIDIEITKWGNKIPFYPNLHYTVYPSQLIPNYKNWTKPFFKNFINLAGSTHVFTWMPDSVLFQSSSLDSKYSKQNVLSKFIKPRNSRILKIPQKPLRFHINLWIYNPTEKKKADQMVPSGKPDIIEVIISDFSFTPFYQD